MLLSQLQGVQGSATVVERQTPPHPRHSARDSFPRAEVWCGWRFVQQCEQTNTTSPRRPVGLPTGRQTDEGERSRQDVAGEGALYTPNSTA
jgi:hypothetical protein